MAIYSKLVQGGEGDMIGHIAYSLYKDDVIRYIKQYKTKHGGNDIPDEKLNEYKESRENDIDIYRNRANQILVGFLQEYYDEIFEKFIEKVNKGISEQIEKDIKPNLPPKEPRWKRVFWGSVQSMCGAILLSFFIWLFATVVGKYKLGDISIEIKNNGKHAQQEQVVQPK